MQNLQFDKDQNIRGLSLSELEKTLTTEDLGRKKTSTPIPHYKLIPIIQDMLGEQGYKIEIDDIVVSKRGLKRIPRLDPKNEFVLESVLVQNLVTSFNVLNFNNKEMNMRLGLSYSEKGITLAFGTNIKVCTNMTIMGASNMLQTYGQNKLPYDKFLELAEKHIKEMETSWNSYQRVIEELKGKVASPSELHTIVGRLEHLAVQNAYIDSKVDAPFNISETTAFTKALIAENAFNNEVSNLWDIFNIGTDLLTHSELNIADKWQSIASFGNHMIESANISIQEAVIIN